MSIANDPQASYRQNFRNVSVTIPDSIYRAEAEDYVAKFARLLREWRRATLALSSIANKTSNNSFRQIVELGDPIVPLIISELRRHPDFLYLALQEIIDEPDIVPAASMGNPRASVEAWLNWAERTRGHAD